MKTPSVNDEFSNSFPLMHKKGISLVWPGPALPFFLCLRKADQEPYKSGALLPT